MRRWALISLIPLIAAGLIVRYIVERGYLKALKEGELYFVENVIDGDTVELKNGASVRLLGVDAPEKGRPYSRKATEHLKRLIENSFIRLKFDVERKDRYGRYLAYIYDAKWKTFVNAEMLREGLAYLYVRRPNYSKFAELRDAQVEARRHKKGVWSRRRKREEYYIVKGGITHRPSCPRLREWKGEEREYERLFDALDSGAPPCRLCRP